MFPYEGSCLGSKNVQTRNLAFFNTNNLLVDNQGSKSHDFRNFDSVLPSSSQIGGVSELCCFDTISNQSFPDSIGLVWQLDNLHSKQCPGDATADGLEITLREPFLTHTQEPVMMSASPGKYTT